MEKRTRVRKVMAFWSNLIILYILFLSQYELDLEELLLKLKDHVSKKATVEKSRVRFTDVLGIDEYKEELEEIVRYLKNPEKFQEYGAELPKGILLSGPPGTGKTMLAKAVAGEADCSFIYMSGSEFEQKFVGVGAKRVRNLFEKAKKSPPAVIFIDEIDAVAGRRIFKDGNYQTLNQLLTEMDGFLSKDRVIVIGATNLPDNLDPAIMRPGRFDKVIHLTAPDQRGRKAMLLKFIKEIQADPELPIDDLVRRTVRFTGADLRNLVNHAILNAVKENHPFATIGDFDEAYDKILMGVTRRGFKGNEENIRATAYHEGRRGVTQWATRSCRW